MSSFHIFISRLKQDLLFQYRITKTILDWSVLLYFVVPGTIIAFFIYRSWWFDLPQWSESFTFSMIGAIFFLISWKGNNRTFVQEADGVFFLTHKMKFLNMIKWAFVYSIWKAAFKIIFLTFTAMPFLLHHFSLNHWEIASFSLFYIGITLFIRALKFFFQTQTWKEKLIMWAVFLFMFLGHQYCLPVIQKPVFSVVLAFLFIIFASLLAIPRVLTTNYFQNEVQKENQERLRLMNSVLGAAPGVEKPKIIKRKKAFLFRHSRRIFKQRTPQIGLTEVFIKIILRNFTYLSGYFKLIAVTSAAIIVIPKLIYQLILIASFTFFMWGWVANLWDQVILQHPIGKQSSEQEDFFQARKKVNIVLTCIATGVLMVIVIVKEFLG
ncbi:ABC-2 type transport system permease protein [Oikeobacillus pervagus]|uniref:ABC-2 type transport system permease protein n=1 Tax=Oikeobacillus pervagus TaxID=1325931 RepID=A0AAJ1T497_9BACI|nr:ABC transporter permease [Oikeobacillus pervagus]MDQ0215619.1 ABC-2 type transport system permease protein [Oikeobacillus pervagus]